MIRTKDAAKRLEGQAGQVPATESLSGPMSIMLRVSNSVPGGTHYDLHMEGKYLPRGPCPGAISPRRWP